MTQDTSLAQEGWLRKKVGPIAQKINKFRWAFPIGMVLIGLLIPPLHTPVGAAMTTGVWIFFVISLLIMGAWLFIEFLTVTDRSTPARHLQVDDQVSYWVALGFMGAGVWMFRGDGWAWWFVVPFFGSIFDGAASGWFAINNAAQKPYAPDAKNR